MNERIDPVCGMAIAGVAPISHAFHGEEYTFCSDQCREAFMAHPHVYVGQLGQKAPKALGVEVLKKRKVGPDHESTPEEARAIEQGLAAVMGLKSVAVRGPRIQLTYDLLQATAMQIEAAINVAGGRLSQGTIARLRRTWMSFGEDNELSNLEVRKHNRCH